MKNLSLLISRRTSSQSVMTHVAATAVAVSIAVMIVTLAVIFGFREEMGTLVSRFAADVTVTDLRALRASESLPVTDSERLRELIAAADDSARTTAYAVRGGVIRSERGMAGMILKGVGSADGTALFADVLSEGELPQLDEARRKEILISRSCADELGISAGARVELLFIEESGTPRRELFKVCGIYDTGLNDERATLILTDIRNVRKINGWDETMISGYEVRTDDFDRADEVADAINRTLFELYDGDDNLSAVSARQLHSEIFAWLGTHDVNAAVIVTIMFIVALFNMITALLILVFERARMIGILKTLGMTDGGIRRIFVCRAAALVIRGLLWGNAVGIGLVMLQKYTQIIKLDAEGYNVAAVPVSMDACRIAAIDIGFAAIILLILAAVTTIVSRIRPAETIRYE